jgi:hypothetical protein
MTSSRAGVEQAASDAREWERDRAAWNLPRSAAADASRERKLEASRTQARRPVTSSRETP